MPSFVKLSGDFKVVRCENKCKQGYGVCLPQGKQVFVSGIVAGFVAGFVFYGESVTNSARAPVHCRPNSGFV